MIVPQSPIDLYPIAQSALPVIRNSADCYLMWIDTFDSGNSMNGLCGTSEMPPLIGVEGRIREEEEIALFMFTAEVHTTLD